VLTVVSRVSVLEVRAILDVLEQRPVQRALVRAHLAVIPQPATEASSGPSSTITIVMAFSG
jgi:hypothetical protein